MSPETLTQAAARRRYLAPKLVELPIATHRRTATMVGFSFLGGKALVKPEQQLLSPRETRCAALAILGATNEQIAKKLRTTLGDANRDLRSVREKLNATSKATPKASFFLKALGSDNQAGEPILLLSRAATDRTFRYLQPGEQRIIAELASGATNEQVAATLHSNTTHITNAIYNISQRSEWEGRRELLVAGGIFSGIIGPGVDEHAPEVVAARQYYFDKQAETGQDFAYRQVA